MATRPIYISCAEGPFYVLTKHVEFDWHPGFALKQKQKSIKALHIAAVKEFQLDPDKILEISSKSESNLGVSLSAFNLMITTLKKEHTFSVESAYQSSKVFENGGPFVDLLSKSSLDAKRDERLKDSGRLKSFRFFNTEWELNPVTAFYDWLYINALSKHDDLIDQVLKFSAFTDISFNPEKSLNCQAYSAALFVSLFKRNLIIEALRSKEEFLDIVSQKRISNSKEDESIQNKLTF